MPKLPPYSKNLYTENNTLHSYPKPFFRQSIFDFTCSSCIFFQEILMCSLIFGGILDSISEHKKTLIAVRTIVKLV